MEGRQGRAWRRARLHTSSLSDPLPSPPPKKHTPPAEVRPELFLGTFRCMECMTIVPGVEQQFKYTQPVLCPNATCGNK